MKELTGMIFTDPVYDGDFFVCEITDQDLERDVDFDSDTVYLYNDYIYKFKGVSTSLSDAPSGSIIRIKGCLQVKPHDEETKHHYYKDKIYSEFRNKSSLGINLNHIVDCYLNNYDKGTNIITNNKGLLLNSGNVFVPEILPDDDPLTIIIKEVILSKEVNLNMYRTSHDPKLPTLDNLRSGIIEPSRELSFPYFLGWCSVLDLDWVFSITDRPGEPSPMCGRRVISNFTDRSEVEEDNAIISELLSSKNSKITAVLLLPNEDPLKRLIKLALMDKRINIKEYKSRGSTPNLVNNMLSTLKGKSKMSISYFINWCEILGLCAEFTVSTKDGKCTKTSNIY